MGTRLNSSLLQTQPRQSSQGDKNLKRRIYRDKGKKYLKFLILEEKSIVSILVQLKTSFLKHKGQSFTIRDIQYCFDTYCPQLTKLSDWSIWKILKENLRFIYKRLCLIQLKLFRPEYTRMFFESALLQIVLEDEGYELLYVDEFSINFRSRSNYGWGPIGDGGFLKAHEERFSMSFMVGFSCRGIYGVIETTESHIFESFIFFISNSLGNRTNFHGLEPSKLIIAWDNSSIHKSKEVIKFLKNTKIQILTICPYWPTLNPAEKLILFIKQKLKMFKVQGR